MVQKSFSALSLYSGGGFYRIEARNAAVDAGVEGVMPEYFALLGAHVARERGLTDLDNALIGGAEPVAVVSHRLLERMFGGDLRAVGETITIDATPVTIVGVTAPGFYGLQFDVGADVFVPLYSLRTFARDPKRPVRAPNAIARLAPGVTIGQARAEVLARWPAIQASNDTFIALDC